jgi:hypothetical protein
VPRGALDAFLLNGLTVGMKAGGQAFLDEMLSALGDRQLEAIKATAEKILKTRSQTVIQEK